MTQTTIQHLVTATIASFDDKTGKQTYLIAASVTSGDENTRKLADLAAKFKEVKEQLAPLLKIEEELKDQLKDMLGDYVNEQIEVQVDVNEQISLVRSSKAGGYDMKALADKAANIGFDISPFVKVRVWSNALSVIKS